MESMHRYLRETSKEKAEKKAAVDFLRQLSSGPQPEQPPERLGTHLRDPASWGVSDLFECITNTVQAVSETFLTKQATEREKEIQKEIEKKFDSTKEIVINGKSITKLTELDIRELKKQTEHKVIDDTHEFIDEYKEVRDMYYKLYPAIHICYTSGSMVKEDNISKEHLEQIQEQIDQSFKEIDDLREDRKFLQQGFKNIFEEKIRILRKKAEFIGVAGRCIGPYHEALADHVIAYTKKAEVFAKVLNDENNQSLDQLQRNLEEASKQICQRLVKAVRSDYNEAQHYCELHKGKIQDKEDKKLFEYFQGYLSEFDKKILETEKNFKDDREYKNILEEYKYEKMYIDEFYRKLKNLKKHLESRSNLQETIPAVQEKYDRALIYYKELKEEAHQHAITNELLENVKKTIGKANKYFKENTETTEKILEAYEELQRYDAHLGASLQKCENDPDMEEKGVSERYLKAAVAIAEKNRDRSLEYLKHHIKAVNRLAEKTAYQDFDKCFLELHSYILQAKRDYIGKLLITSNNINYAYKMIIFSNQRLSEEFEKIKNGIARSELQDVVETITKDLRAGSKYGYSQDEIEEIKGHVERANKHLEDKETSTRILSESLQKLTQELENLQKLTQKLEKEKNILRENLKRINDILNLMRDYGLNNCYNGHYLRKIQNMCESSLTNSANLLKDKKTTIKDIIDGYEQIKIEFEKIKKESQSVLSFIAGNVTAKISIAKDHNCLTEDSSSKYQEHLSKDKSTTKDLKETIESLMKELQVLDKVDQELSEILEENFKQYPGDFKKGFKSVAENSNSNLERLKKYAEIYDDIKSLDYINKYQRIIDYYIKISDETNKKISPEEYYRFKGANNEMEKLLMPYQESLKSLTEIEEVLKLAEEKSKELTRCREEYPKVAAQMKNYLSICSENVQTSISAAEKYVGTDLAILIKKFEDLEDLSQLGDLNELRKAVNLRRHVEELGRALNIINFHREFPTAESIQTKYRQKQEVLEMYKEKSNEYFEEIVRKRFKKEKGKSPTEKEFELYYEEYLRKLDQHSQTLVQNKDVWICREADKGIEILEDGRIKTMFETETTGSRSIQGQTELQANVEWASVGLPLDLPKEWRPIYLAIGRPFHEFGSVALRIKEEVKAILFKMMGDSFKLASRQLDNPWLRARFIPFNGPGRDCFPAGYRNIDMYRYGNQLKDPLDIEDIKQFPMWTEAILIGGAPIDFIRDAAFVRPIDEVEKKKLVKLFEKRNIKCHDVYYDLESDLIKETSEFGPIIENDKNLDISWVNDCLAVGGSFGTKEIETLKNDKIKLVVDARKEGYDNGRAMKRSGIELCYLPVADGEPLSIEQLMEGTDQVNERLSEGERVLIHCEHGIGRSVLLTCAVLVTQGMSAEDALKLVQEKREQAAPNSKQVKRLKEFEKIYHAKAEVIV